MNMSIVIKKTDEAILSFAAWTKAGLCDTIGLSS